MTDPEPEFLDDEISLANSGTGTLVFDDIDISDETPEETALRTSAEESWRQYTLLRRGRSRRIPVHHHFELRQQGRREVPAVVCGNRPSVILTMSDQLDQLPGGLGGSGATTDLSGGNLGPASGTVPVTELNAEALDSLGAVGGAPAPTNLGNHPGAGAIGAASGAANVTVHESLVPPPGVNPSAGKAKNSARTTNTPIFNAGGLNRDSQVMELIQQRQQGPGGHRSPANVSMSSQDANRSFLQRAKQSAVELARTCASPFRQAEAPTIARVSPNLGPPLPASIRSQRASVHFQVSASTPQNEGGSEQSRNHTTIQNLGTVPMPPSVGPPRLDPAHSLREAGDRGVTRQGLNRADSGGLPGQVAGSSSFRPMPVSRNSSEGTQATHIPTRNAHPGQRLPLSRNSSEGNQGPPYHSTPHESFQPVEIQEQPFSSVRPVPAQRSEASILAGTRNVAEDVGNHQNNNPVAVPVVPQPVGGIVQIPALDPAAAIDLPPPGGMGPLNEVEAARNTLNHRSDPRGNRALGGNPADGVLPRPVGLQQQPQPQPNDGAPEILPPANPAVASHQPINSGSQILPSAGLAADRSQPHSGGHLNPLPAGFVAGSNQPQNRGPQTQQVSNQRPVQVAANAPAASGGILEESLPEPEYFANIEANRQTLNDLTNRITTGGIRTVRELKTMLDIIASFTPDALLADAYDVTKQVLVEQLNSGGWWLNQGRPLVNEINAMDERWNPIFVTAMMQSLQQSRLNFPNSQPANHQAPRASYVPYVPNGTENQYQNPNDNHRQGRNVPRVPLAPLSVPGQAQPVNPRPYVPRVAADAPFQIWRDPDSQGGSFEAPGHLPPRENRTHQGNVALGANGGGRGNAPHQPNPLRGAFSPIANGGGIVYQNSGGQGVSHLQPTVPNIQIPLQPGGPGVGNPQLAGPVPVPRHQNGGGSSHPMQGGQEDHGGGRGVYSEAFIEYQGYDWPSGWQFDLVESSSVKFSDVKSSKIDLNRDAINYRSFRDFFKHQVHQNRALITQQRTSLLQQCLSREQQDMVGAYPTSALEEYADMLLSLDEVFGDFALESFIKSFNNHPPVDLSRPSSISSLIGLLTQASRSLSGADAKTVFNVSLKKLDITLRSQYTSVHHRSTKQNLTTLRAFLSNQHKVENSVSQPSYQGYRKLRSNNQVHASGLQLDQHDSDSDEFECAEEMCYVSESKNRRTPRKWDPAWPKCPVDNGEHFLLECEVFRTQCSVKQRLEIVERNQRCRRCFSPRHGSVSNPGACTWKRGKITCDICQSHDHHYLLHVYPEDTSMVSACAETVLADVDYKSKLFLRHTQHCTLMQSVARIRNPRLGDEIIVNCAMDSGCTATTCDNGVVDLLRLVGPKITNRTKAAGGMIHTSPGILAEIEISDLDNTFAMKVVIRFSNAPAGNIEFFDWNKVKDKFQFLRDIDVPSPVFHKGLPPIPLIIGTDLACLFRSKSGSVERGALGPMSPLAQETQLGWCISGYTSPDPPSSRDVLNGNALVLDSRVVLSHAQPDPFAIDENSIFLSSLKSRGPFLEPELDEHEKIEELLDTVSLLTSAETVPAWGDIGFDLKRAFEIDRFSGDSCDDLNSEELLAQKLFHESFVENNGVCTAPILWKKGEPDLPNNYKQAVKKYEGHERRMLKHESSTKAKSFYDQKMAELKRDGYIKPLDPSDPDTIQGFFLEAFTVVNERKTTSALRLVFNARALFRHNGALKSLNSAILSCPNNMVCLLNVLLKMSQFRILIAGDVQHFFHRVRVMEKDRRYLKILWRDEFDPNTPLKVYQFDSHLLGKKDSPYSCIETAQEQSRRYQAQYPLAHRAVTRSMLVDDLATSVDSVKEALQLKGEATELFKLRCDMYMRKWVCSSKEVRDQIPAEELSPSIVVDGIEAKENHLVRCLGLIFLAVSDCYTYYYDLPIPAVWTRRSILAVLSKIFDPKGSISPFHVYGRILFQRECLTEPESKIEWDKPIVGDGLKEIEEWIKSCKDLKSIRIPRCQARHKDEDSTFSSEHPYWKHAAHCKQLDSCSCFWENTAAFWKAHRGLGRGLQNDSDIECVTSEPDTIYRLVDLANRSDNGVEESATCDSSPKNNLASGLIESNCKEVGKSAYGDSPPLINSHQNDHSVENTMDLEDSIQIGASAFGLLDEVPHFTALEKTESERGDGFFEIISQEYHAFCDASQSAYGAIVYSVTHYRKGPPTVRPLYAKGRVTPKGKGSQKSIPRLELVATLLATEVAGKVVEAFELPDLKSNFTFWSDSMCVIFWLNNTRAKKQFVHNRVTRVLNATNASQWRHCDGVLNPADVVSRGKLSVKELIQCHLWWHGPPFLYVNPVFWPEKVVSSTPGDEAMKELLGGTNYLLLLADASEGWRFDADTSSISHPGRFESLIKLVRFKQIFKSYFSCLRAYTASIRKASSDQERDDIRKTMQSRLKSTCKQLKAGKELKRANDLAQTEFYAKLLGFKRKAVVNPEWKMTPENGLLAFKPRESFQEVKRSLIFQAQTDVYGKEMEDLRAGKKVAAKSELAKLKPLLNPETGLLEVRGRFSEAESDRFNVVLPKSHPITRLIVKDIHTSKLGHFGAITTLMAEVKRKYYSPHLKSLVIKLLDDCYTCRRRYPRAFKQQMAPFHVGKIPGRLGESQSPFAFSAAVNCDFLGPVYTSQGRGKAREKRWIFVFCCSQTKSIYLQLVYSSQTSDILTGLLTFFLRKGVPKMIISDGQTGLKASDKEIKDIRARIADLQDRLKERLHDHDFADFEWTFTAPRTPSQNGQVERQMSTIRNAMNKMSEFNPKGYLHAPHHNACLKDKELEFLLVRVESVLNSAPLSHSLNQHDDLEVLTRNHFCVGGNSPIRLCVPKEILGTSNEFNYKWFRIEECLLKFWDRWHSEHLNSIMKVPKWTSGEANLSPGQLVMVMDRDDPELRKRIKWPIGRVTEVHRDADGRIQTVELMYKKCLTRRGVRQLAPLPGADF